MRADKCSGKIIAFRVKWCGFTSRLCRLYWPQPPRTSCIRWDHNLCLIPSQGFLKELPQDNKCKKKKVSQVVKCSTYLHVRVTKSRAREGVGHSRSASPRARLVPPSIPRTGGGRGWVGTADSTIQLSSRLSGLGWLRAQLKHFKCTSISKPSLNWPPNPFVIVQFGAC